MGIRRNRIKLRVLTEKELKKQTPCNNCNKLVEYGKLYFYVDESNIAITNNSKGICSDCKSNIST